MHYNAHFSFSHNIASFPTATFNTFTTFMLVRETCCGLITFMRGTENTVVNHMMMTQQTTAVAQAEMLVSLAQIFPKMLQLPPNSTCQERDMRDVLKGGPTILEWPVNITVTLCFLLGAWELIHVLVRKGKTAIIVLKVWCAIIQNLVPRQPGTQDLCMPAGNFGQWHQTATTVEPVVWQLT